MPILEARDVHYAYETHRVLRGVSLALERGKLYAILGPSGCGKTTLLSLLGGLDSPTQGQILFDGEDIAQHGLARHRRDHVSFVFQAYNLIDYLTPAENVALSGTPHPLPLLEQLGLTPEEARRRIATLSGGQFGRRHRPGDRRDSPGQRPWGKPIRGGGHPRPCSRQESRRHTAAETWCRIPVSHADTTAPRPVCLHDARRKAGDLVFSLANLPDF